MVGPWKLARFGRASAGIWAWRNRRELGRWLGFAWRAVPVSVTRREDVLAETRLRMALGRDARIRGTRSLSVRVTDGIASLGGDVEPDVHDLVAATAQNAKGIHRLDCRIRDRGRRRTPLTHPHAPGPPALPPPPGSGITPRPDLPPDPSGAGRAASNTR